jgi:hypothetical protein
MHKLSGRLPGVDNRLLRKRILRTERQLIPAKLRKRPPPKVALSEAEPFGRDYSATEISVRGRAVARGDGGAALEPFGSETLVLDRLLPRPSLREMEESAATWPYAGSMPWTDVCASISELRGYDQPEAASYLPYSDGTLSLPADGTLSLKSDATGAVDGWCGVPAHHGCVPRPDSMTDSFPSARDIAMPRHVVGRTYEFAIDEQYFPLPCWDKRSINRPCMCQDCPICGQG